MVTRAMLLLSLILLGVFDASERAQVRYLAMASSACSACRIREELRALSLEAIKEQILNKLGLKQAPNMTGRALPRIPPISKLMDMYGMQADQPQSLESDLTYDEVDEYSAKTEVIFVLAQSHPRIRHSKSSLDVLYFTFTDKALQHRVIWAELNLWIWDANSDESLDLGHQDAGPVTITLQRILRGTSESGGTLLGPPLTTKHPRPQGRRGDWVTIELRRMVTEWFKHPRDNLGIAVKITGSNGHRRNPARDLVEIDIGSERSPFLEVRLQEHESRQRSRIKRNIGLNCDETSQETRCCRYKLTVDFEKFGWDWIIAPKKYEANYCSGDCPMAFLPAYPNTHIISLTENRLNNSGPCCAPRKLSEITMLYFDNEYQIVFSRLPSMVVEKCGCS